MYTVIDVTVLRHTEQPFYLEKMAVVKSNDLEIAFDSIFFLLVFTNNLDNVLKEKEKMTWGQRDEFSAITAAKVANKPQNKVL